MLLVLKPIVPGRCCCASCAGSGWEGGVDYSVGLH